VSALGKLCTDADRRHAAVFVLFGLIFEISKNSAGSPPCDNASQLSHSSYLSEVPPCDNAGFRFVSLVFNVESIEQPD
jgi:hypothetical protein